MSPLQCPLRAERLEDRLTPAGWVSVESRLTLPDGKTLLAGSFHGNHVYDDYAVGRLNADGSPDPAFGADGVEVVDFGWYAKAVGLTLGPGGTIVSAGTGAGNIVAVRMSAGGGLDRAFGANGVATAGVGIAAGFAAAADGSLYVGGSVVHMPPGSISTTVLFRQAVLARFDAQGQVAGLYVNPDFVSGSYAALALDAGGGILAEDGGSQFHHFSADLRPDAAPADGADFPTDPNTGPPTIDAVADQTVPPSGSGTVAIHVRDSQTVPPGLVTTATSSDPALAARLSGTGGDRTLQFTAAADFSGPATVTVVAADAMGLTTATTFDVTVPPVTPPPPVPPPPSSPPPTPMLVASAAAGVVRVVRVADGVVQGGPEITFFSGFTGPIRTAVGDVDGDGVPDEIGGAGPGGGPRVRVVSGATGLTLADFFAFEPTFTGGVFVAAGDFDGDGKAEVVVTPGAGGGPVVAVYDGAGLAAGRNAGAERTRFFGIADPAFRGGDRAAAGDVDGDGRADLVVAAGAGGGPRVAVYAGGGLFTAGGPARLRPDFFAFEPTFTGGVFVAAGDLTRDGRDDLVFGAGTGGGRRVFALDGGQLLAGRTEPLLNFYVGNDPTPRDGAAVAVLDLNGDNEPDVAVSQQLGVRVYDGRQLGSGFGQEPTILADVPTAGDDFAPIPVG